LRISTGSRLNGPQAIPPTAWRSGGLDAAILSLAVACALLWLTPYEFPNGSHAQEIPPILARLDQGLFTRDFAVRSFLEPTPRAAYQQLIAALAQLGIAIPVVYLVLQIAALTAAVGAAFALGFHVRRSWNVYSAAAFAIPFSFLMAAVNSRGWNVPLLDAGSAVPSTFAMPFALWGWYLGCRRRWGAALALFGLAAILQVLVGLLPVLLLAPVIVTDVRRLRRQPRHARSLYMGLTVWIASLLVVVAPMWLSSTNGGITAAELIRVFGKVRAPHHWLPSSAGSGFWLNQAAFWAAGLLLAGVTPRTGLPGRLRLIALLVLPATALLMGATYVFVEQLPVAFVAKLQLQRVLPFAALAIVSIVAWHSAQALHERRYLLALALVLAPLPVGHGATLLFIALGIQVARRVGAPRLLDPVMLAGVVAIGMQPGDGFPNVPLIFGFAGIFVLAAAVLIRVPHRAARVVSAGAAAMVIIATSAVLIHPKPTGHPIVDRFIRNGPAVDRGKEVSDTVRRIAAVVAAHVPATGLLLDPPLPSLGFIPLLARRSVVLTWGTTPYTDDGIAEWGRRLDDLLAAHHERALSGEQIALEWSRRSGTDLVTIAHRYGAEFVLTRDAWQDGLPGVRVGHEFGWSLWQLRSPR
jgi:hypothetical protein